MMALHYAKFKIRVLLHSRTESIII